MKLNRYPDEEDRTMSREKEHSERTHPTTTLVEEAKFTIKSYPTKASSLNEVMKTKMISNQFEPNRENRIPLIKC